MAVRIENGYLGGWYKSQTENGHLGNANRMQQDILILTATTACSDAEDTHLDSQAASKIILNPRKTSSLIQESSDAFEELTRSNALNFKVYLTVF